ncbi:MAG: hypothetical protein QQW96_03090 [Tychonema bourrellyi B0820]|nr:hypothetical protein [Tychonema bourrellyi B0820]
MIQPFLIALSGRKKEEGRRKKALRHFDYAQRTASLRVRLGLISNPVGSELILPIVRTRQCPWTTKFVADRDNYPDCMRKFNQ